MTSANLEAVAHARDQRTSASAIRSHESYPSLLVSGLSVPAGRVAHVESGHSMIVHVREQSRI